LGAYKGNLRDSEFILFEYLKVGEIYGTEPFDHIDTDGARMMLGEALKFADEVMGDLNVEGDRHGCTYENGRVITPPGFKEAYKKYMDAGWQQVFVDLEDGGAELPPSLGMAVTEFFSSANFALKTLVGGSDFGVIIKMAGTEEQIKRFCPGLFDGRWGGAMALTEADAGSDVGAIKTRARRIDGDIYSIEGTKRFITCAEHDLSENIITLALARIEGAPAGTKGLSMFIIPNIWVNEDGSLGEPNDVACTGIEHKMGLKASPTCQVSYGENGRCRGILVGNQEGAGMKQMFLLINKARMMTAAQAIGQASSAYLNSLAYARERLQGSDLKEFMNKNTPRVPIIRHPDVRRMLLEQKSKLEGMRGLILKVAHLMDLVKIKGSEEAVRELGLIDVLTPIVKGYCAEESFNCNNLALQVLGGSGYCRDYPVEQYLRDTRITSIYEGTTHIQAMDLVRKLGHAGGAHFISLLEDIESFIRDALDSSFMKREIRLLGDAVSSVRNQGRMLVGFFGENIYLVGLYASGFLFSLSEVVVASILLEMARVAAGSLADLEENHLDYQFYTGKIESARFFCHSFLPVVTCREQVMSAKDTAALDIPEGSF